MRLRIALGILFASMAASGAQAAPGTPVSPEISAPEAVVIDGWTGARLYSRNADVPRSPASTVKIMTALVVLRRHIPLNRIVTVPVEAASYGGSTAGLYAGERLTVWNLLHGMLLPSGNDAAITLADAVAGTPDRFVNLMNQEAARLKLGHTHFLTPNGYDRYGQVTTASDLATIARVAMRRGNFAQVVRSKVWTAVSADGATTHTWTNLNKLLWWSGAINGIKTGTTPGAGACLVSSARMGGRWIIEVNMGSNPFARFSDGMALLNYGLAVDSAPPSTR